MSLGNFKPPTETYTYDPARVSVVFGNLTIHGFSEDSLVEVKRDKAMWDKVEGADHEVTRSKSGGFSGSVKFTLNQSSSSNDDLDAIARKDEENLSGMRSLKIKDGTGVTKVSAQSAWIIQRPSIEFKAKPTDRVWELSTGNLDIEVGGNFDSKSLE